LEEADQVHRGTSESNSRLVNAEAALALGEMYMESGTFQRGGRRTEQFR